MVRKAQPVYTFFKHVIPADAGIQGFSDMDSGLRRNDGKIPPG